MSVMITRADLMHHVSECTTCNLTNEFTIAAMSDLDIKLWIVRNHE